MGERIKLLDHGYAECVESWGSDERIIESARMSTGGGFVSWEPYAGHPRGDAGLLRYLYEHKHSTPFEMAGMTVEIQAPIFVFRQWHRHRTQSYNEMSARYAPLPDLDYAPTFERLMSEGGANKQAGKVKGAGVLTEEAAAEYVANLRKVYRAAQALYEKALSDGVPKELARIHLPVARYSVMRASANLRNWLAFLTLRSDPHAQYEIRVYADAVGSMIAERFPRTWALFVEGRNKVPA